jgi:hypothetical protein
MNVYSSRRRVLERIACVECGRWSVVQLSRAKSIQFVQLKYIDLSRIPSYQMPSFYIIHGSNVPCVCSEALFAFKSRLKRSNEHKHAVSRPSSDSAYPIRTCRACWAACIEYIGCSSCPSSSSSYVFSWRYCAKTSYNISSSLPLYSPSYSDWLARFKKFERSIASQICLALLTWLYSMFSKGSGSIGSYNG